MQWQHLLIEKKDCYMGSLYHQRHREYFSNLCCLFICLLVAEHPSNRLVYLRDGSAQFYVLPHWDRSCRSNVLPHPVTVYWHLARHILHVISTLCVARDLHTIAPGPLERTCWRQLAAQWEDCKKSRVAPFNAIIIIVIIYWLAQGFFRVKSCQWLQN